jgi:hypothetical protein
MSSTVYLMTIFIPVGALVAIFCVRAWSAAEQAKARLANEEGYRQIALRANAAQAETAAALGAIQETLAEVRGRLAAIEKVLKDVG